MEREAFDFKSAQCILCKKNGLTYICDTRDSKSHWVAGCNACGHVQLTPLLSADEEEKLYQENEMLRGLVPKTEMDDTQLMNKFEPWADSQLRTLERFLPKDKAVLEIGSGYGWLVEKARNAGYTIDGIELSRDKCEMARQRSNIILHSMDIMSPSKCFVQTRSYDAVCLFHIVEHLTDPIRFIRRAAEYLKAGGKIIIEVPNINAYMKQCSEAFRDFQYFIAHVSYFSDVTLRALLEKAGFGAIQIVGKQLYSIENSIHWMRNKVPFKPYCQFDLPDGLEFVNSFFKEKMENDMTSDMLIAVATLP